MVDINRCLEGIVSPVKNGGRYGFVNNPKARGSYEGQVPRVVFVHRRVVEGQLRNGISVAFNIRPSTRAGHEGEFEACDVMVIPDEQVSEGSVLTNSPDNPDATRYKRWSSDASGPS